MQRTVQVKNFYVVKKYDRTLITLIENNVMHFGTYDQYKYNSIYENVIFDTSGSSGFDYTVSDGVKYFSGGMLNAYTADLLKSAWPTIPFKVTNCYAIDYAGNVKTAKDDLFFKGINTFGVTQGEYYIIDGTTFFARA